MSNGVKSWSYSALSLYEQCPAKFKYAKLDKLPEPKSEALIRGIKIHDDCDKFLTGQTDTVPTAARKFAREMEDLKSLDPFTEQQWGFDRNWRPVAWTDWKKCWLRGKLDAGVVYADRTADIIDFKTGKPWPGYEDQLDLFGTMTFIRHPTLLEAHGRNWYLDSGVETEPIAYYRDALKEQKESWEARVEPMFNDTVFAPKPNKFCNWCHFRKSNGGDCPHG